MSPALVTAAYNRTPASTPELQISRSAIHSPLAVMPSQHRLIKFDAVASNYLLDDMGMHLAGLTQRFDLAVGPRQSMGERNELWGRCHWLVMPLDAVTS